MDYFDRDEILPKLKTAAKKYEKCRPIEKIIITRNTTTNNEDKVSHCDANEEENWN